MFLKVLEQHTECFTNARQRCASSKGFLKNHIEDQMYSSQTGDLRRMSNHRWHAIYSFQNCQV